MVTIGAFAIALVALGLFVYCEYNNYWQAAEQLQPLEQLGENEAERLEKLEQITARFESENKNIAGLAGKFRAIWRFVSFVLFQSKQQKQERCRRNELTAEKLLLEYQVLVRLPGNERVDRFIRWRDDVADFESRKKAQRRHQARQANQQDQPD